MRVLIVLLLLTGCAVQDPENLVDGPISFEFVDSVDEVQERCRRKSDAPMIRACAYNKLKMCHIILLKEDWMYHAVHELEHCWNQRRDDT